MIEKLGRDSVFLKSLEKDLDSVICTVLKIDRFKPSKTNKHIDVVGMNISLFLSYVSGKDVDYHSFIPLVLKHIRTAMGKKYNSFILLSVCMDMVMNNIFDQVDNTNSLNAKTSFLNINKGCKIKESIDKGLPVILSTYDDGTYKKQTMMIIGYSKVDNNTFVALDNNCRLERHLSLNDVSLFSAFTFVEIIGGKL